MQLSSLGKSGFKISPILMGTWQAGKEMWAGIDDDETKSAIRAAFEAGITTFDTAEAYGKGHSERVLGAAVSDHCAITRFFACDRRGEPGFSTSETPEI